ncbi:MAG: TonB-dependent receptor [Alphaproteobacteria bacterium]|nr:TonB-dependent receptor [Alphaproteobacteria bacterium]
MIGQTMWGAGWLALAVAMGPTSVSAQEQPSGSDEAQMRGPAAAAEPVAVDPEIVVTGTLLRGVEPLGASTRAITRQDIARSGRTDIGEVVSLFTNALPSRSLVSNLQSTDNFSGGVSVDLGGLGVGSTLTLLNGRRLAGSGETSGAAVDVSTLPVSVIDRIEVFSGGASALYGSDAIGGVVNIVLRRDFSGLSLTADRESDVTGDPGSSPTTGVAALGGLRWSGGGALLSLSYRDRKALPATSRARSQSDDLRPFGGSDRRSGLAQPGNITALGAMLPGLPTRSAAIPAGQNGTALRVADLRPVSGFPDDPDFAGNRASTGSFSDLMPRQKIGSIYAAIDQQAGDWDLTLDLLGGLRTTRSAGFPSASYLLVPRTNPFNPFGQDVAVAYLFAREAGTPVYVDKGRSWSATLGGKRDIGGWRLETFLTASRDSSRFRQIGGSVDLDAVDTALAQTDRARAFNPFGDGSAQSAAVLGQILTEPEGVKRWSTLQMASVKLDGDLFSFPAGPVKAAVVAQAQRTTYDVRAATDQSGSRKVFAVGGEVLAPLAARADGGPSVFDLSLAARFDRYSDFGNAFSPSVGLRYRPVAGLSLRGGFSRSFRAPNMPDVLGTSQTETIFIDDPARRRTVSVPLTSGGNPDLKAETASIWTAGVEIAPEALGDVKLSVGFTDTSYRNRIVNDLNPDLAIEDEGILPPGIFVRNAMGRLVSIDARAFNAAQTSLRAVDASLDYGFEIGAASVRIGADATYTLRYRNRLTANAAFRDDLGELGNPRRFRANANVGVSIGRYEADLFLRHIGSGRDRNSTLQPRIAADTTFDLTLGVGLGADREGVYPGRISLSVRNLFNRQPAFADQRFGFDYLNGDIYGRAVAVKFGWDW